MVPVMDKTSAADVIAGVMLSMVMAMSLAA
jgi:hypothetical protein